MERDRHAATQAQLVGVLGRSLGVAERMAGGSSAQPSVPRHSSRRRDSPDSGSRGSRERSPVARSCRSGKGHHE
jgi:hypothetical protein